MPSLFQVTIECTLSVDVVLLDFVALVEGHVAACVGSTVWASKLFTDCSPVGLVAAGGGSMAVDSCVEESMPCSCCSAINFARGPEVGSS